MSYNELLRVMGTEPLSLIVGQTYKLSSSYVDFEYTISVIYAGSYDFHGSKSHRFVHVVKNEDYMDFLRVWVHRAANCVLGKHTELEQNTTVMHTDIFHKKLRNILEKETGSSKPDCNVYLHSNAL